MSTDQRKVCINLVTHVLNAPVRRVYERLRVEAPADHDLRVILNSDDPAAPIAGLSEQEVVRIRKTEFLRLPYPGKCFDDGWAMSGNLDLAFLEFARRHPRYEQYWFVEYDVHWEGVWSVFFNHFRDSDAAVLATSVQTIDEAPHKLHRRQPALRLPPGMAWAPEKTMKAFLPICRLSRDALAALDADYRAGLSGHYELTVPTVAAHHGLTLEDVGGHGKFVKPENLNRFYMARPATYTHSPGTFVFRPGQRPLHRHNTLWHPVKPGEVPVWHPMRMDGGVWKRVVERIKPLISRFAVRWWFATRWRPLRDGAGGGPEHGLPDAM